MFFSKVTIAVHDGEIGALSDLICGNNGYGLHQAIWKLFQDPSVAQRDFLYRYETEEGKPVFYVVSQREPVPHRYTWEIRTKPYAPKVREGERLAFSLRANPVKAGKNETDGKYARHDVVMAAKKRLKDAKTPRGLWPIEAQLIQEEGVNWLESRSEGYGFQISPDEVRVEGYQQHRYSRNKSKPIRFSTVDYEGFLTVTDPELFVIKGLFRGVGHCKAFGCGMLMVRRV
jgi:CRISPR system Cascade subunit CasE